MGLGELTERAGNTLVTGHATTSIGEIKMPNSMKLYNHALAPNPRRVRIFAAEKGIAKSRSISAR